MVQRPGQQRRGQEARLEVNEMRMRRRMYGVTRSEMNTLEGQQEWCKPCEENARCGHIREKKKRAAKPKMERCL